MMRRTLLLVAALLLCASCGGGGGVRCSLDDQTTLLQSDWPSFRHDSANTGRSDAAVGTGAPQVRCLFPRGEGSSECSAPGTALPAIDTSVVVGTDRLGFITRDGEVHFLRFDGTQIRFNEQILLASTANTPLLGADGTFYLSTGAGSVFRIEDNGTLLSNASLASFIATAPVMDGEGVIYVGTVGGSVAGICPNGGLRFNLFVAPTRSGIALTSDPLDHRNRAFFVTAGDSGRVQGFSFNGLLRWSFFASSPILAPTVIDEQRSVYFVLTQGGQIHSGDLFEGTGLSSFRAARCAPSAELHCVTDADCPTGEACLAERISAAAALGSDRLYVATEGNGETGGNSPGTLYALDLDVNGVIAPQSAWEFQLPTAGVIRSSPAVTRSCDGDLVIFGADLDDCDGTGGAGSAPCGTVYAVDASGLRWSVSLAGSIGTLSPAVRDTANGGVVYIGTDAGYLYEIAPGLECAAAANPSQTSALARAGDGPDRRVGSKRNS